MVILIGFCTVLMVLNCLLLILVVLMQLPKKEAGAGLAFGGAATDALFGAGSGNFLTKLTKWLATIFFVLALMLAILQNIHSGRRGSEFRRQIEQQQTQPAPQTPGTTPSGVPAAPAPPAPPTVPAAGTNTLLTPPSTAPLETSAPPQR